MSKVWFVTGSARGIGRAIVEAVLQHGGRAVGGVREPGALSDLSTHYPGHFREVLLDMDRPETFQPALDLSLEAFGRVDVLVNNAGYGLQGMVEEITMTQARAQMETNFFGLLGLTQVILPILRAQKDGVIFNVSSVAGLRGSSCLGLYNASKFAVNGLSEALAQEMKPFGVRVMIVEPGPYRTDWAGASLKRSDSIEQRNAHSPYAERNATLRQAFEERSGKQPGDPRQIASVLLGAAEDPQPPMHLLFGDVAMDWWGEHYARLADPSFFRKFPHSQYNY